jgi:DNA-binding transcriptional LysR family regulator
MVFCASPAFLERHGHPSTAEALRRMPRLAFSGAVSPGDWIVHDGDGRPVTIDGPLRLTANNTQMLLAAALAGAGVAYGPSFVFGEAIAAGRLIALLADHRTSTFDIHALFPTARHLSGKVRHFIDLLSTSFGAQPAWDSAPAD